MAADSWTVVVTRAPAQSEQFAGALREKGYEAVCLPAIRIISVEPGAHGAAALERLARGEYGWIVFSSANGVEELSKLARAAGLPARVRIAAQGSTTARAVESIFGRKCDLVPAEFIAEELARAMSALELADTQVLIAAAKETRDVIAPALRRLGAAVDELKVYETAPAPLDPRGVSGLLARDPRRTVFTFFSPSAVQYFTAALGEAGMGFIRAARRVSIGPVTSAALAKIGLPCDLEAGEHSESGVLEAICRNFKGGD